MPLEQFHPMIVHFPIVLALLAVAFDFWSVYRGAASAQSPVQLHTSTVILTLGAIAAVLAYILGDIAYDIAVSKGVKEAVLETHEGWGTTTMAVYVVVALFRLFLWWRRLDQRPLGIGLAVSSSIVVACMVVITAYFGGHLVYDLGVNIQAMTHSP